MVPAKHNVELVHKSNFAWNYENHKLGGMTAVLFTSVASETAAVL